MDSEQGIVPENIQKCEMLLPSTAPPAMVDVKEENFDVEEGDEVALI